MDWIAYTVIGLLLLFVAASCFGNGSTEGSGGVKFRNDVSAASRPCRPPPEILSASAALHLRQERCSRAGGASAATAASAPAVPRAVRVALANPAEVVTVGAC